MTPGSAEPDRAGANGAARDQEQSGAGASLARVSPAAVRWAVMAVFLLAIPGMIVASINGSTGVAVTLGLLAGGAAIVLIAVTAVSTGRIPPTASRPARSAARRDAEAEAEAEGIEHRIQALVAAGAPEQEVRSLVRAARRMR